MTRFNKCNATLFLLLLSGCASQHASSADPYGFFSGIWHGVILTFSVICVVVSWVLSLIGVDLLSDVSIFGEPNTGLWYYVGFVVGIAGTASPASSAGRQ